MFNRSMVHVWLNMFENTVYEYNIHDIYNYSNVHDIMGHICNCYEMDRLCSYAILSTDMYKEWYQHYNKQRTSVLARNEESQPETWKVILKENRATVYINTSTRKITYPKAQSSIINAGIHRHLPTHTRPTDIYS